MNLIYKIASMVLPIVAGIVAKKLSDQTWKFTTGKSAQNPDDPEVSYKEAAGFALLSGALVGAIKMLMNRQTSKLYMKANGKLPPELDKKLGLTEEQSRAKVQAKDEANQQRKKAKQAQKAGVKR